MSTVTVQLYQPIGVSKNGLMLSKEEWEKAIAKFGTMRKIPVCYGSPSRLSPSMDELMSVRPQTVVGWANIMDNGSASVEVVSEGRFQFVKDLITTGNYQLKLRGLCNYTDKRERHLLTNIRLVAFDLVSM